MPKLLFVDGKPQFIHSMQTRLESSGYEVIIAYDGEEGLEKARSENPDLIILDFKMPVMDCYTMLKEFRMDEQINNIPIIICTTKSLRDDEDNGQMAGADDYIKKPFESAELLAKIESLLNKSLKETPLKKKLPKEGKRKYPRLKKDVTIDFKLVNSLDEYQLGMSENISPEGVKLETIYVDKPLIEGQFMEMILKGAGDGEAIKVLGQIIWVDRMKFSFKTKMGIKLIFLLEGDAGKIKKLLK